MDITAIGQQIVQPTLGQSLPGTSEVLPGSAGTSFGQLLGQAIGEFGALQGQADLTVSQLAQGLPVELHNVMLAQEQANLTFQLVLQTRNKMLEAYQEVMRMQV